jgi:hypothetical protein
MYLEILYNVLILHIYAIFYVFFSLKSVVLFQEIHVLQQICLVQ